MRRAQRGDREAFAMLVHRHIDPLYNYALRLCRVPVMAEDLVQEAWLAAWQSAASYKPGKARLSTWLHRIVHNKFIDAARKDRMDTNPQVIATAVDDSDMEVNAVARQQVELLDDLIDDLPPNQKSAVVLTHIQGFSNAETADIMGVSVRAVESLLARGRRALKQQVSSMTNDQRATGEG